MAGFLGQRAAPAASSPAKGGAQPADNPIRGGIVRQRKGKVTDILLYISGPSCSGKTTLRERIVRKFPVDRLVIGDEHWLRYPGRAFDDRVRLANASIIEAMNQMRGALIVCEWVPIAGAFLDELQRVCGVRGMRFLQVALNADTSTLRKRKMIRDGDDDTDECDLRSFSPQHPCLLVDTGRKGAAAAFQVVGRWLSDKIPQRIQLR